MKANISGLKKTAMLLFFCLSLTAGRAQTPDQLKADQYFSQQNYKKAADYYSKVLSTDSNNIKVLHNLGISVMNLKGQQLTSSVYFNHIIRIDSANVSANYYLGIIYKEAAKEPDYRNEKANFKSLSETYLKRAAKLGNKDATVALKELPGI